MADIYDPASPTDELEKQQLEAEKDPMDCKWTRSSSFNREDEDDVEVETSVLSTERGKRRSRRSLDSTTSMASSPTKTTSTSIQFPERSDRRGRRASDRVRLAATVISPSLVAEKVPEKRHGLRATASRAAAAAAKSNMDSNLIKSVPDSSPKINFQIKSRALTALAQYSDDSDSSSHEEEDNAKSEKLLEESSSQSKGAETLKTKSEHKKSDDRLSRKDKHSSDSRNKNAKSPTKKKKVPTATLR